jgi:predicted nucleotide-binding protein (sugar kinase/HSP70/actin superfamily)
MTQFQSLAENLGKFHLDEKIVLIPEMNHISARLFAATFRGFGVDARVLETFRGLTLGKEHTSGKECYPCLVTLGDILYFIERERERLRGAFDPQRYVYFLPESAGPCRFGMYNKFQRIALDSFPDLKGMKIGSLSANDGYSLEGMIDNDLIVDFKKAGYLSIVIADILERLLWRIRPYESRTGLADDLIQRAVATMEGHLEKGVRKRTSNKILEELEDIIAEGKRIIDPQIPPRPLIGIVGEIFLRMHSDANQGLIRMIERHGGEVLNASLAEWVNYVSYEGLRNARSRFWLFLRQLRFGLLKEDLKSILQFGGDLLYKEFTQRRIYRTVRSAIDLTADHKIAHLERTVSKDDIFSFDIGTEACLSIASIIQYERSGYNGVVNVYPFTCMPSMTTSAVVKPIVTKRGIPYLDVPCEFGVQPGREAAIRTFLFQAAQHLKHHGRKTVG